MRKTESAVQQLAGKVVNDVDLIDGRRLTLRFTDGVVLRAKIVDGNLSVEVSKAEKATQSGAPGPTERQLDYLRFIEKYRRRYGIAPAESDICRHFLVSAPSVNQMMQTLERRGFISRERGVARSIKLRIAFSVN